MIRDYFLFHYPNQNQLPSSYANLSLIWIGIIILILMILSLRRYEKRDPDYLSMEATNNLKGLAVIFLILGHLSIICIEGKKPFDYAGIWAVTIFLLLSGIAIAKKYGFQDAGKLFIKQRVKRLLFPVWITFILFYILEFVFLNNVYSAKKIMLSFLGIINPFPPNGPAWFITYIIFLYAAVYLTSKLKTKIVYKTFLLFLFCYLVSFCIISFSYLDDYFGGWVRYTIVFPLGIVIGLYRGKIMSALSALNSFIIAGLLIASLIFYFILTGTQSLSNLNSLPRAVRTAITTQYPIFFIIPVLISAFLLDTIRLKSGLLSFLGKYSFEIYLLHFPFMAYYDFLLFRKPLIVYFFMYVSLILILSLFLKKATSVLNRRIFRADLVKS